MGTSGIKNIGILGGMFDPVHFGHLRTALAAQQDFGLDEVRLMPCHHPVHREEPVVDAQHRLAMLYRATRAEKYLVVDNRECMRPGPSYMIETLASLREQFPDDRLFLLLGADAFNKFDGWKRWQEIADIAHLIVIIRPGFDINPGPRVLEFFRDRRVADFREMCRSKQGKVLEYGFMPLMIASSEIRDLIRQKKSVRYLVPNKVISYIKKHKLYS